VQPGASAVDPDRASRVCNFLDRTCKLNCREAFHQSSPCKVNRVRAHASLVLPHTFRTAASHVHGAGMSAGTLTCFVCPASGRRTLSWTGVSCLTPFGWDPEKGVIPGRAAPGAVRRRKGYGWGQRQVQMGPFARSQPTVPTHSRR
jgi:hypothetical protein